MIRNFANGRIFHGSRDVSGREVSAQRFLNACKKPQQRRDLPWPVSTG